jgi:heme/copper-type cytochrome/quinol oxidase subunit 1
MDGLGRGSPTRLTCMGENETSGEHNLARPGRLSSAVVPLAGVVAEVVGIFAAWSNRNTSIGWFAYAPLSNQEFTGNGTAFVSQGTQIGLAIVVAGLLVLAFWAGLKFGRRSAS